MAQILNMIPDSEMKLHQKRLASNETRFERFGSSVNGSNLFKPLTDRSPADNIKMPIREWNGESEATWSFKYDNLTPAQQSRK